MKLAPESHAQVEEFLRAHLGDPELRLPPVSFYAGRFARLLMRVLKMGAITFGRHVFVAPSLVTIAEDGRMVVPAWLVVHESMHVLQYERSGYLRFFVKYLLGYWRALCAGGRWDAAGRMAAYFGIDEERDAREAENAYRQRNS
ncbi:MAG TPA: hypothetical protein VM934_01445 [Pyrinomonadaceae bacterium]|jgi:hypothetical protein|nr:hypothetical protein [Pyrinomonadaceae bacterium]